MKCILPVLLCVSACTTARFSPQPPEWKGAPEPQGQGEVMSRGEALHAAFSTDDGIAPFAVITPPASALPCSDPPEALASWQFSDPREALPAFVLLLGSDAQALWAATDTHQGCVVTWPFEDSHELQTLTTLAVSAQTVPYNPQNAPSDDIWQKVALITEEAELELFEDTPGLERVVLGELGFLVQSAAGEELGQFNLGLHPYLENEPISAGQAYYQTWLHQTITLELKTRVSLEVVRRDDDRLEFHVLVDHLYDQLDGKDGTHGRFELQLRLELLWTPTSEEPFFVLLEDEQSTYGPGVWDDDAGAMLDAPASPDMLSVSTETRHRTPLGVLSHLETEKLEKLYPDETGCRPLEASSFQGWHVSLDTGWGAQLFEDSREQRGWEPEGCGEP